MRNLSSFPLQLSELKNGTAFSSEYTFNKSSASFSPRIARKMNRSFSRTGISEYTFFIIIVCSSRVSHNLLCLISSLLARRLDSVVRVIDRLIVHVNEIFNKHSSNP